MSRTAARNDNRYPANYAGVTFHVQNRKPFFYARFNKRRRRRPNSRTVSRNRHGFRSFTDRSVRRRYSVIRLYVGEWPITVARSPIPFRMFSYTTRPLFSRAPRLNWFPLIRYLRPPLTLRVRPGRNKITAVLRIHRTA